MSLLAPLLGAALGALGANRNRVRFTDERVLWMAGGAVSAAALAALAAAVPQDAIPRAGAAWVALGLWAAGSLACAVLAPVLDRRSSRLGWRVSAALKAIQCPLSTLLGWLAATLAGPGSTRLLRGAWFAAVGEGRSALALGAFVLAQRAMLEPSGQPREAIALHESYHTRNAGCLGETGFYAVYLTLGVWRAIACGAPWNGLAPDGRGNPFERTAYAIERESQEALLARHEGRPA